MYTRADETDHKNPFRDRIRHVAFSPADHVSLLPPSQPNDGKHLATKLVWEMDWNQIVLTERREMRVRSLGRHEYFIDIVFEVTTTEGPVTFTSDSVHYAWPYVWMNKTFNVNDGDGTITNSEGELNREGTNGESADWVDNSARVQGQWEGLALFSHPDNPKPHRIVAAERLADFPLRGREKKKFS